MQILQGTKYLRARQRLCHKNSVGLKSDLQEPNLSDKSPAYIDSMQVRLEFEFTKTVFAHFLLTSERLARVFCSGFFICVRLSIPKLPQDTRLQRENKRIQTRQIGEGMVVSRRYNLTQYKSFQATPCGSFTALTLLRYTCSKGTHIPSQVCLVLKAL